MSKRLTDLQKQRALLQEHLAWLDREIAAEQNAAPSVATPLATTTPEKPAVPAPQSTVPPGSPPSLPQKAPTDPDQIIAEFQQNPASLQQDTRRGCLIAFWLMLLGTLLIAGTIYAIYAWRLGRWW